MGKAALVVVTALTLSATVARAQARPDFSGTWILVSAFPAPSSTTWNRIRVVQDSASITIDNHRHALDGSVNPGVLSTQTSTVAWAGNALVITRKTELGLPSRGHWEDLEIYSLSQTGSLVVIRMDGTPRIPRDPSGTFSQFSMVTTMAVYERSLNP